MVQKEIIGKVISTTRDKTVTVAVERKIAHYKYHKIITRTKRVNYITTYFLSYIKN